MMLTWDQGSQMTGHDQIAPLAHEGLFPARASDGLRSVFPTASALVAHVARARPAPALRVRVHQLLVKVVEAPVDGL